MRRSEEFRGQKGNYHALCSFCILQTSFLTVNGRFFRVYVTLLSNAMEKLVYLIRIYYRSKLGDHVLFDDYLNYLDFNFVSDEICSHCELNAIKILYKMCP